MPQLPAKITGANQTEQFGIIGFDSSFDLGDQKENPMVADF